MKFHSIFKKLIFVNSGPFTRLLTLAGLVGIVSGLGAILFFWLLNLSTHFFQDFLLGYRPIEPAGEQSLFAHSDTLFNPYLFFIVPALGGLLSGLIVFWFAPEAEGHGTDAAIESFHYKQGIVKARVPLVKIIASALTIGSGGSGGREGPIAQIGAGFGSLLAQKLGLNPNERRILMIAGMGAGIGAIFHAPLAGALFASEVLYKEAEFEYEVLVPTTIASTIAYAIFNTMFGWEPLFETPGFDFRNPMQLIPYTVLAFAVVLGAKLFVKMYYRVRELFLKLPGPPHLKPFYGGLLVGTIGFFLPEAIGTGYGVLQQSLDMPDGPMTLSLLLLVVIGKMAATSFSIGSGGSGGVFGPSIVIGGALGGAVGMVFMLYLPYFDVSPGAFVLVGMAGFFVAAAKTPISMVIMVSEMTGNYHLLVPTMWVNALAFFLSRGTTMYEKQLPRRIDSPAHFGNFMEEILKQLQVQNAIDFGKNRDFPTIKTNTSLFELLDLMAHTDHSSFPVVDNDNKLIGMIDVKEVRMIYKEQQLGPLVIAQDFMLKPITRNLEDRFKFSSSCNCNIFCG